MSRSATVIFGKRAWFFIRSPRFLAAAETTAALLYRCGENNGRQYETPTQRPKPDCRCQPARVSISSSSPLSP